MVKSFSKAYKKNVNILLEFFSSIASKNVLSKNKGKLLKKARGKYQNLSEEEKHKKRQYWPERQSVNMVVSDIKNF